MSKKNKKKKATSDVFGTEDAQEAALKEAVEAARESAVVLREAASVLSQASAVSRWGYSGANGISPQLPYPEDGRGEVVPAKGVMVNDHSPQPSPMQASSAQTNVQTSNSWGPSSVAGTPVRSVGSTGSMGPSSSISSSASPTISIMGVGGQPQQSTLQQTAPQQTAPQQSTLQQTAPVQATSVSTSSHRANTTKNVGSMRRNAKSVRASVGYKPKEPNETKSSSPFQSFLGNKSAKKDTYGSSQSAQQNQQGYSVGSVNESLLANLPKFGEAPDPLPEPEEILQSVPSLTSLAFGQTAAQASGIKPITSKLSGASSAGNSNNSSSGSQVNAQSQMGASAASSNTSSFSSVSGNSGNVGGSAKNGEVNPSGITGSISIPAVYGNRPDDISTEMPGYSTYSSTSGGISGASNGISSADRADQQYSSLTQQSSYSDSLTDGNSEMQANMQGYDEYGNYVTYEGYEGYANYDGYAGYDQYDPYATEYVQVKGGKATVSIICGILSILLGFIPPIGIILAIVAILTSRSYIRKGGTAPRASTGRVCGIVGIILSIVVLIAAGLFVAYFFGGLYGGENAGAIMGYLQTTPLAAIL